MVGERTTTMMKEVLKEVEQEDPVKGRWDVPRTEKGVVWCDASSIATGVLLGIGGVVAEDATWLRKKDDASRRTRCGPERSKPRPEMGITRCALKDRLRHSDFVGKVGSHQREVGENHRSCGDIGEVKIVYARRFHPGIRIKVTAKLCAEKNKADILTRVRKTWLRVPEHLAEGVAAVNYLENPDSTDLHDIHHLARKVIPNINREEVRQIVRACDRC